MNNELVGDTLELEIHKFFNLQIDEKYKKIWEFKPELRRMCVVKDNYVIIKGAPESILPLCKQSFQYN